MEDKAPDMENKEDYLDRMIQFQKYLIDFMFPIINIVDVMLACLAQLIIIIQKSLLKRMEDQEKDQLVKQTIEINKLGIGVLLNKI